MKFDFSSIFEKKPGGDEGLAPQGVINSWLEKIGLGSTAPATGGLTGATVSATKEIAQAEPAKESIVSSLSKTLIGPTSIPEEYYFPVELIGGTCPRIYGEEEEIVWNAAAEACDSERVHVVWHAVENRIWYIAVRSGELASRPNTWCPFAALLPGMKDSLPPPACYTYYGDDSATMIVITSDSLQIFRSTSPVVRAKAERAVRELGDVPLIELVPDKILNLTPVPWYSLSLFEDRARRILAATALLAALALAGFALVIWLFSSMALIAQKHDLTAVVTRGEGKTIELMQTTQKLRESPMREQLAKFSDLNDGLLTMNGLLQVYEIKDGKVRWRAVIPSNITADRINEIGGKSIETTPQGLAIGNAAEIEFEATGSGKK